MKDISVEVIKSCIRDDIAKRGYKASKVKFSKLPVQNQELFNEELFSEVLLKTGAKCQVDFCPPVSGNKVKRFIKKIIRKFVMPSFIETMKKQNEFNQNSVAVLKEISKKLRELEEKLAELEIKGEGK